MADYTRKQLKERWEKAKRRDSDPDVPVDALFCATATTIRQQYIPGLWEIRIFPRWFFERFKNRKIIEPPDSAIMSRNESYDPKSGDTQEWGWYRWRYYFDTEQDCYVLELNYDVQEGDRKALPMVKGILDLALLESTTSIIGKFKWRIRWLQRVPILRRIPPIFLFFFEMKKIEEETIESTTGYPARIIEDDENVIKFPKASESWGKVKAMVIFDPRKDGKCIAWFDTGDGETFTGEDDDICSQ